AAVYVNTLIVAESIMRKRQRSAGPKKSSAPSSFQQLMTMNDINKKKEKIEDEEKYGEVRMELLLQKCFKPVLQVFLRGFKFEDSKKYLKSKKFRHYAKYINNLLFAPRDSRIQTLSSDQVPIYEQNMIRLMVFKMIDMYIKSIWQYTLEKEEPDMKIKTSIIYNTRTLLGLLNKIY